MSAATCSNIAFGQINLVEVSALSSVPESVTDINNVKNHERARPARWKVTNDPIVVDGVFDEIQFADFFSLIGSTLPANSSIKLEAFAANDFTGTDLVNSGDVQVGKLKKVGDWIVGVDEYNVPKTARGQSPLTLWFGERIGIRSYRLTIVHGYVVEEVEEYNDIPTQNEFGVVALEAQDGELANQGASVWSPVADASASGGVALYKTGGGFYTVAGEGPSFKFVFSASQTGTSKVWIRYKSIVAGGNDSFFTTLDGASTTAQNLPVDGAWHWVHAATVSLVDGNNHELVISARENNLYIDKIAILPNADPAPTGTGPAASSFGVVGAEKEAVDLRMLFLGRIWQPENNYSYGYDSVQLTAPEIKRTTSGHPVSVTQQREVRQITPPLEDMTGDDAYKFRSMEKERAGRPIFISGHPKHGGWLEDEHTGVFMITNQINYKHIHKGRHSIMPVLTEV